MGRIGLDGRAVLHEVKTLHKPSLVVLLSAYCAMRSFSVNSLIRFPKLGMASIALSNVLLAMVFCGGGD